MAKTLSKSGITTGNTVEAYHVTQSIDAFTGTDAYDITLSGSFNLTGPLTATSMSGNGSGITGVISSSYAVSSSYAMSSSYAVTSSYAVSSSYTVSSSYAVSSSYVLTSSYAVSSSYSLTSSYAVSSSYASYLNGPFTLSTFRYRDVGVATASLDYNFYFVSKSFALPAVSIALPSPINGSSLTFQRVTIDPSLTINGNGININNNPTYTFPTESFSRRTFVYNSTLGGWFVES